MNDMRFLFLFYFFYFSYLSSGFNAIQESAKRVFSDYKKSNLLMKSLFIAQAALPFSVHFYLSKNPRNNEKELEKCVFYLALASTLSVVNWSHIPFKELLRKKPCILIEKNPLETFEIKLNRYLPFSNKEIHSYIEKNNNKFKFKSTQEYIEFLKDKNNFLSFAQFDSLIAQKMQKIKAFDSSSYKNKVLPVFFYFLTGKNEQGFPSDMLWIIKNSMHIKKNYLQLYTDRLKMTLDIVYFQHFYKTYKNGIEFFEKIAETKKVLSYESFLNWLNLSIEKRTLCITNCKHIVWTPLICISAWYKIYFPWHLFLMKSELNIVRSIIIANILNQFTKALWMIKHPHKEEGIFELYDELEKKYQDLIPNFKENYHKRAGNNNTLDLYSNFMEYIILDKTKKKIEKSIHLNNLFITYDDLPKEWDFFTSLVKNCKIYCLKDCQQAFGAVPCRLQNYMAFGFDLPDHRFFDDKDIFDQTLAEENEKKRTINFKGGNTLTAKDYNIPLNKNKTNEEILVVIEKKLKLISENLYKEKKKLLFKDFLGFMQKTLLYFF